MLHLAQHLDCAEQPSPNLLRWPEKPPRRVPKQAIVRRLRVFVHRRWWRTLTNDSGSGSICWGRSLKRRTHRSDTYRSVGQWGMGRVEKVEGMKVGRLWTGMVGNNSGGEGKYDS